MKKHNFSAGPSILPQYTFEECSKAVLNLDNEGLSLLEISHRSDKFISILEETKFLFKELLNIPDNYDVLFIQGGASMQFCMVPYNLLNTKACYLDTGTWSSKAIKEASFFGEAEITATSKDKNYTYIPRDFTISKDADYFHITTNNTIYGTQVHHKIDSPIPVVADMSSDILSRIINVSDYDLIYAGAQKNIGPSGLTIVIINKDILGKVNREIPSMLDYRNYIEKESMFNTPPTFAIFATLQTLKWLNNLGGVSAIEKVNIEKANLLYAEIDRNTLFFNEVEKNDRSFMNVTFKLHDTTREKEFLAFCEKNLISGIKGHRSVGGFRASIYNAMPTESVQKLVNCMQQFEKL